MAVCFEYLYRASPSAGTRIRMNTPLPRSTRVESGTTGILTPLHKGATFFWKNQQRFEIQAPCFKSSATETNLYQRMDIHEVRRWTSELNVLVVEDDEVLRESFQQLLSYLFAEVDAAVDGQDAFDQWVKKQHDIVVTDLNMPRLSGFRLIKKIHQQAPQQAMIGISAYEDEIFQQALTAQEVNYLIQPVSLEGLLNVLIPVCQSLPLEHQGY